MEVALDLTDESINTAYNREKNINKHINKSKEKEEQDKGSMSLQVMMTTANEAIKEFTKVIEKTSIRTSNEK